MPKRNSHQDFYKTCVNDTGAQMLSLKMVSKNRIVPNDQSTNDLLVKGSFGDVVEGELRVRPEELLYLMDVRNAECSINGSAASFNEVASIFSNSKKLAARYFSYKDWRDRGLIAKYSDHKYTEPNTLPVKKYPAQAINLPKYRLTGVFFKDDLFSIVGSDEKAREIYDKFWIGQYGTYKAAERGKANKLDIFETMFLMSRGMLKLDNSSKRAVEKAASARRSDFSMLNQVYEDWRTKGFVIKTGFKFGTHFRVYFPGARPVKDENWMHSKHVIQVFPKNSKMLISEWARAIRVAHSVRKTFILAIPGKSGAARGKKGIDYILYHRAGGEACFPPNDAPKYAMLSLGEEEYIGGRELASAIRQAIDKKMELILGIVDRETAVTYYKVRKIELPKSRHEYYEIDWMQP